VDGADPHKIGELVAALLKSGRGLDGVDDPLEAEAWASAILAMSHKQPVPFELQQELERSFLPRLVQAAERKRDRAGLAMLCALASVSDDPDARAAAERMKAHGLAPPPWAAVIGRPQLIETMTATDPFGDQIGYYFLFRYAGEPDHLVLALYDENLGGIIKDAVVAPLQPDTDILELLGHEPDVEGRMVKPAVAAGSVISAVANGDLFVDNDWSEDFRQNRALLLARMRQILERHEAATATQAASPGHEVAAGGTASALPYDPPPPEPPGREDQEALIQEFMASPLAAGLSTERDVALAILDHCMTARCDFGDGDPLRWSPIVVELFMLDFLPRKVTLDFAQIAALPEVLAAWVRFCLGKRGLAEHLIIETQDAVARYSAEFREAVTNPHNFGLAKAFSNAMRADGVDLLDEQAVAAWMAAFNARPQDERDAFLGPHLPPF
jgi:hypothetical protein